jgi:S-adenosylmethionine decarboxylase
VNGLEWIVEGLAGDRAALANRAACERCVERLVADLALTPVAPAQWHHFPSPGGLTAVLLLAESHLALHTFPEHGSLTLNVFCCRPRPPYDFAPALLDTLGITDVRLRAIERTYATTDDGAMNVGATSVVR